MTPDERFERIERQMEQNGVEIAKQNEGIRGVIVVARTSLDSIQELRDAQRDDHTKVIAEIKDLREAQAVTDEKLSTLIDTVDRMIRKNGKEPHEG